MDGIVKEFDPSEESRPLAEGIGKLLGEVIVKREEEHQGYEARVTLVNASLLKGLLEHPRVTMSENLEQTYELLAPRIHRISIRENARWIFVEETYECGPQDPGVEHSYDLMAVGMLSVGGGHWAGTPWSLLFTDEDELGTEAVMVGKVDDGDEFDRYILQGVAKALALKNKFDLTENVEIKFA